VTTLVTGADGLLGSHLVRELLARGHRVRAFLQPASGSPTLDGLDIERVTGDLLDSTSLRQALDGVDRVVHAAALTDQHAPAERHWAVNFDGTRSLTDAVRAVAPACRVLLVGSASTIQFGTRDAPGDEAGGYPTAYEGVAYVASKHAAMEHVRALVADGALDAVLVAPTFLLGAHDWRPSSGQLLLEYLRRSLPVAPPGGRNFVGAADVAVGAVRALELGVAGDTTLLGGHNLTYEEFFTHLALATGARAPRAVVPVGAVRAAGTVGGAYSLLARRAGRPPGRFNRELAELSTLGCYYDNAKAVRQLDLPVSPIGTSLSASLRSLRTYGHLPTDPLDGSVALVSGASRGVGLATARALAARGARVVLTARGTGRLDRSVEELRAGGADVVGVSGDVGVWDDAQRMVAAAIDTWGRLDIVVNNAGVSMRGRFEDLSEAVCTETIQTNLLGSVYVTRAAVRHLVDAGGHVLFVSSIAGIMGLPGASNYCASKAALRGLAESLRLELGPRGVHVGVAYIGYTEHDPEKRLLGANGELLAPDRPAHQTQDAVAAELVAMLDRRRRQVVLTPVGKLGAAAHRLSPLLVERVVAHAEASDARAFRSFA
jgi:dihydroflavonol-4-reductase